MLLQQRTSMFVRHVVSLQAALATASQCFQVAVLHTNIYRGVSMSGAMKLNASWTFGTGGRQDIDKQMVVNEKLVDGRVSSSESLFTSQALHYN